MIELQTYSICYPDENHRRNLRGFPDFPDLFFIQLIHNQMKAKQHLENEKCELIHIGLVRSIIYALYPLRASRQMTESYLNRYCYADMRTHAGIDAPLRENEVEPDLAPAVRLEVLNVIFDDESFAYAREMIMMNNHMYRLPNDDYNLLLDPLEIALTKELDAWQKVVAIICEPIEEGHVRMKMKQLLDILIEQHENTEEKQMATDVGDEEDDLPEERGFTVSQVILCFHYICQEQRINFKNSLKTDWARCIARISGKSEKRIRNSLDFDLESRKTQRDLTIIYPVMSKLFPEIGEKILMDMKD